MNWRDSNRTERISSFVKLDGTDCGGNIVAPAFPGMPLAPVTVQKSTISTSIMTEKPFLFSPLELTGTQSVLFLINDIPDIPIYLRRRLVLGPACDSEQSRRDIYRDMASLCCRCDRDSWYTIPRGSESA